MECVNEGWIKFDTEKDENRFIHLVRDIAPSVQPEIEERREETAQNVPKEDLISRKAAIEYCYQLINVEYQQGSDEMNYGQERINQTETILHHLEFMPPAQSEIIRCKDCKYADEYGVCQSSKGLAIQDDDDFCSHAERRGG